MSYSNSFPTQRPTLNLDFANGGGQLDSRISYSRSSTGAYLSDERHLSSENLLLQSQDFDTSPWNTFNLASSNGLTGGQAAPDGTSTAWLMTSGVSSDSANAPSVYMNLFGTASGMVQPNSQNTYVMHVKAGTATHAWVTVRGDSSNYVAAVLDFSNTSALTTYQSGWTLNNSALTALGNSWYRIALTFTSNSVVNVGQVYVGPTDSNTLTTYYPQWPFNGETLYAWGAQLSSTKSKVYDSPTTTQIHREYAPTLKTAAANAPRFEYDADGNAKGLLIEAQATNLQRYGSAVGSWSTRYNVTIGTNTAIAPDGSLNADLIIANSNNTLHYAIDAFISFSNATQYTLSAYVKDAGQRYVQLVGPSAVFGLNQWATFDLQTGSVDVNGVSASAVSVGNGWWRIEMTATTTAAGTSGHFIALATSATSARNPSFIGDNYKGILVWGAQVETGSRASSLVDTGTSSSSATRSADSCSVALNGILVDGQDVTLYAEGDFGNPAIKPSNRIGAILQRDSSNYINLYNGAARSGTGYVLSGGVVQAAFTSNVTTGEFKTAISAKPNSFNYASNGIAATEDTSGTVPNYNSLHLGQWYAGTLEMDGTLKRVTLYGQALSATELAALTS